MLFSIIITTKNNIKTIKYVLNSTKFFSMIHNTELIIVDGYSFDGTYEYILKWINNNSSFFVKTTVLRDPGHSLSEARNLGFMKSQGDILILMDGDMILSKNFAKNISRYVIFDAVTPKTIIPPLDKTTKLLNLIASLIEYLAELRHRVYFPFPRILKRKTLEEIGGYPFFSCFMAEDQILKYLLLSKNKKIILAHDLVIYKIEEPGIFACMKKHFRYGQGLQSDIDKHGASILREYMIFRRISYINVFIPVHSIVLPLLSRSMLKKRELSYENYTVNDLLSVSLIKYVIDFSMFLGEIYGIFKKRLQR